MPALRSARGGRLARSSSVSSGRSNRRRASRTSRSRSSRGRATLTPSRTPEGGTRLPINSGAVAFGSAALIPDWKSWPAEAVNDTSQPAASAQGAAVAQTHLTFERRRPGRTNPPRRSPPRTCARRGIEPHRVLRQRGDRKSTRLNSSHANISYAVFCLKKKKKTNTSTSSKKKKNNTKKKKH